MDPMHHAAAKAALDEIQGVLHKHSIRKPDTTPDMTASAPDAAPVAENALLGELVSEEAGEEVAEAPAKSEAEPLRLTSYGKSRPNVKRGPGRPRKA